MCDWLVRAANVARKHLLLGFGSSGSCFQQMRTLGFPQAYAHLGEEFETGEVVLDRHDDLASLYNVSTGSCNTFVFVPKCVRAWRGVAWRGFYAVPACLFVYLWVRRRRVWCSPFIQRCDSPLLGHLGAARWTRTSTCCRRRASCS